MQSPLKEIKDQGQKKSMSKLIKLQQNGKFTLTLTPDQFKALKQKLPIKYTLMQSKHLLKSKSTMTTRKIKSQSVIQTQSKTNEMTSIENSLIIPKLQSNNWLVKCKRILFSLQKCKSSWPFLQPVNPIQMGIPQYLEIIKNPMDLKTISTKLSQQKYEKYCDFQADIRLIISNSYKFNEGNSEFVKITSQFQNFYNKIILQKMELNKIQTPIKQKLPKNNSKIKKTNSSSSKNIKVYFTSEKKQELFRKYTDLKIDKKQELLNKLYGSQNQNITNFSSLNNQQLTTIQVFLQKLQVQYILLNNTQIYEQSQKKSKKVVQSEFQGDSESQK